MSNTLQPLRCAIAGVGAGVFGAHRQGLELETFQVVGVMDLNSQAAIQRAQELKTSAYNSYEKMLEETQPEVVIILTPHPFHADLAIQAIRAGAHVLVEKPMAVQVAEADAIIQAAELAGKLIAVNYQQRMRPEVIAAKKLIDSGQMGEIQHIDVKMHWTRSAAYYTQVNWRGTWKGEGGGVIMNQGIHEFDLVCFLMGMPARVMAWARTRLHSIETEDTVQAMAEWHNGALGTVHISTAEAGHPQRIEITGTAGSISITGGTTDFKRFDIDMREFIPNVADAYAAPQLISEPVMLEVGAGNHKAVYENLYAAIRHNKPLLTDGISGRMSLELSNAINYSSHINTPVELPLDRQKYADLLKELQSTSKLRN